MYLTFLTTAGIYVGMYRADLTAANLAHHVRESLEHGGLIVGQLTEDDRSPVIIQGSAIASVTAHLATPRTAEAVVTLGEGAR